MKVPVVKIKGVAGGFVCEDCLGYKRMKDHAPRTHQNPTKKGGNAPAYPDS